MTVFARSKCSEMPKLLILLNECSFTSDWSTLNAVVNSKILFTYELINKTPLESTNLTYRFSCWHV